MGFFTMGCLAIAGTWIGYQIYRANYPKEETETETSLFDEFCSLFIAIEPTNVDAIQCFICRTNKKNVALACGHLYCPSCITQWYASHNPAHCPDCRSHINQSPLRIYLPE